MTDTSTTIREQVAEAIKEAMPLSDELGSSYMAAADAAIAIIVEVYRNGQASLIEEEKECPTSETPSGSSRAPSATS